MLSKEIGFIKIKIRMESILFKIKDFKIQGFWGRGEVNCSFNKDVNIIIGRNGTGKTTLMNILHSALTCDLNGLGESDFDEVSIVLESNSLTKEVVVHRLKEGVHPERRVEDLLYVIDGVEYQVSLLIPINHRYPSPIRRRVEEDASEVREALRKLLNVSSVSVYRLRHDKDFEVIDKYGNRVTSPVDYRVEEALRELASYSAELGIKEQDVSRQLQKEVLASILYSAEDTDSQLDISKFNRKEEEVKLKRAYSQLNSIDSVVSDKIKFHAKAIEVVIDDIKSERESIDIKPLEAFIKTRKVIELSLEANQKVERIRKQINLFLDKLKEFMPEKDFVIESGKLVVKNKFGEIKVSKLSSGEKQLIILLIEALLQREQDYLLLADEPEISLHIAWQGKIIPAVRDLNPNAQVIVATHSPEVAAPYTEKIFNMAEIYSE